jgi:hypothetical protein
MRGRITLRVGRVRAGTARFSSRVSGKMPVETVSKRLKYATSVALPNNGPAGWGMPPLNPPAVVSFGCHGFCLVTNRRWQDDVLLQG